MAAKPDVQTDHFGRLPEPDSFAHFEAFTEGGSL